MPFMSKRITVLLLTCSALVALGFSQAPAVKLAPSAREGVPGADALLEEAAGLRALRVIRPVKSGTKSRPEIEAIIIKDFDESSTADEIEAQRKLLVAFGLVAADFRYRDFIISLLTEQVAGFYQSKTKEFFLADWNDPETVKPIIVHELTHALQDQHFDLGRFEKWPRGDGDRELAIHALIEGDATAVMFNYVLKPSGLDIARLPGSISTLAQTMTAETGAEREKVLASAPPAIRESLLFPYSFGAGFVQELVRRRKWEGVSRAYTDLPQSTEQILHIDKYLARETPTKLEPGNLIGILGPGWRRIAEDVNGEFGYSLLLSGYVSKLEAQRASAGWGGDRCVLYENRRTGEVLLAHLSEWDSGTDAGEFFEAYARRISQRYGSGKAASEGSTRRRFEDSGFQTLIERRAQRVLVLEGLPIALNGRLNRLARRLWNEGKTVGNSVR